MHTCYLLCNSTRNKQLLNSSKIFAIVFSGLCHDVGHTGFNNLFEIASRSKKAITYNDNSVDRVLLSPLKTSTRPIPSNSSANPKTTS
jgi:HD superfamily phosphohydrolase